MPETKVHFSTRETELMCNAEFILTKNKVLEKVKVLLEHLQSDMQTSLSSRFRKTDKQLGTPKISRGESYLGLPYLILDFPRVFGQENILAIRTMFWWGNFFSITLHLAGSFKTALTPKLEPCEGSLAARGYHLGINKDPWVHHFGEANFRPIDMFEEGQLVRESTALPHLKIAKKIPLSEWARVREMLLVEWEFLIGCCYD